MKLVDSLERKDPSVTGMKDRILREVLSENVNDKHLRREFKKSIRMDDSMSFSSLQKEAIRWSEEDEDPKPKRGSHTTVKEVETENNQT